MKHSVKIKIAAFVTLSAVGIVYVAGSYLGFVDRILGRGITVHATLPESGGLFEGSEVTYRGVKIGEVATMEPTREGVRLDLALEDGTQLPKDAPMYVHNLSAVGEQYLDFEPADDQGPYAEAGDTLEGSAESMPVDEADLLVELDQFVSSVDKRNLQVVVRELGLMFSDTGIALQQMLDEGSRFIDEAAAHEDETIQLLDNGLTVLRTQRDEGENIRSFARDLRLLTGSLRRSDADLRGVLEGTPRHRPGAREDDGRPGADAAGAARQRGQRQPGGGLAPRRARAAPRHLPSHHLQRLHRDPAQGRRPGQHAVLQQGAALHRGLHAGEPVAPGRPDHRRSDLPCSLRERPALQHAGRQVLPRQ
jgi:virulence factor Mce-like protein